MNGYGPSTYGDGFADVYDEWYGDITDVDATVDRLSALASEVDGPILELGVGTGRLALPLAARGHTVWGIDSSYAMVQRLRRKPESDAITIVAGDMAELDLHALPGAVDVRFGLVFAAYNTLFNLTSPDLQQQCLTRAAAVLRPGGRVVIEAYVPHESGPMSAVEARHVDIDRVVLTVSRRQPMNRVVNGQHVEITEAGIRLRPWVICYATPAQLDTMAAAAGLRLQHRWADWEGSDFDTDAAVHVSVYEAG